MRQERRDTGSTWVLPRKLNVYCFRRVIVSCGLGSIPIGLQHCLHPATSRGVSWMCAWKIGEFWVMQTRSIKVDFILHPENLVLDLVLFTRRNGRDASILMKIRVTNSDGKLNHVNVLIVMALVAPCTKSIQ